MYSSFSEVGSTPHIFSQKFVLTGHLPVRDIFPTDVVVVVVVIIIIIILDLTTVLILKLRSIKLFIM
jgi:hypothetical protein